MAVTAAIVLAAATALATPGQAAPPGGDARVVTPSDGSPAGGKPLASGTATTAFSLQLPEGAACAGDSTEGGYRVQSFMVPHDVDPASLTFGALGPLPKGLGADFRQPLYEVSTTAYANAATNLADEPGGPGTIINVPAVSLGVFAPGDVPPGRYRIGIACSKGGPSPEQLDRSWSPSLVVSAPASGLAWSTSVEPVATTVPASPGDDTADATTGSGQPPDDAGGDGDALTPAADAEGPAGADPADPVVTDGSAPPVGAQASGRPPTFHHPVAELISHRLTLAGSTSQSLILWLAVAAGAARIAALLARTPSVVPVALR